MMLEPQKEIGTELVSAQQLFEGRDHILWHTFPISLTAPDRREGDGHVCQKNGYMNDWRGGEPFLEYWKHFHRKEGTRAQL